MKRRNGLKYGAVLFPNIPVGHLSRAEANSRSSANVRSVGKSTTVQSRVNVTPREEDVRRRPDQPSIVNSVRATKSHASVCATDRDAREVALSRYHQDKHARSAGSSRCSLRRTWEQFHKSWFHDEEYLPLTPTKICCVASLVKAGGSRSYPNYLSRYKELHVANGHVWTDVLQLEAKSSVASVLRGIGPARQSAPFDLQRAFSLESECGAVPQGPVDTICALGMGCF